MSGNYNFHWNPSDSELLPESLITEIGHDQILGENENEEEQQSDISSLHDARPEASGVGSSRSRSASFSSSASSSTDEDEISNLVDNAKEDEEEEDEDNDDEGHYVMDDLRGLVIEPRAEDPELVMKRTLTLELCERLYRTMQVTREGYIFVCDIQDDFYSDWGEDLCAQVRRLLGYQELETFLCSHHMEPYIWVLYMELGSQTQDNVKIWEPVDPEKQDLVEMVKPVDMKLRNLQRDFSYHVRRKPLKSLSRYGGGDMEAESHIMAEQTSFLAKTIMQRKHPRQQRGQDDMYSANRILAKRMLKIDELEGVRNEELIESMERAEQKRREEEQRRQFNSQKASTSSSVERPWHFVHPAPADFDDGLQSFQWVMEKIPLQIEEEDVGEEEAEENYWEAQKEEDNYCYY